MVLKITEARSLIEAYNFLRHKELPITIAYKLVKITDQIKTDVQFYTEKFQEIIDQYADVDENGNYIFTEGTDFIKVKDGLEDECQSKIAELDSITIELDIQPISVTDLGQLNIDADTLEKLLPILSD